MYIPPKLDFAHLNYRRISLASGLAKSAIDFFNIVEVHPIFEKSGIF